ncbi:retropepsin-like aspartic protease [Candidatus Margulisiibacteriota bacterium]
MPVNNLPFTKIRNEEIARPYLPVTILNPTTKKKVNIYALIDTGADECALPASFASILGHNLQAGHLKKVGTGNGITIAYGHLTKIIIAGFTTQDVIIDFIPNLNMPLLGVKSFLSNFLLTVDYPNEIFSLKLKK